MSQWFSSSVSELVAAERNFGLRQVDVGQAVVRQFASSSYVSLRGVAVEFHEGVVTLRGRVTSFYLNQVAQAIAAQVLGVEEVANHLEVAEPDANSGMAC